MTRRHSRMLVAGALFVTLWLLLGSAVWIENDPTVEQSLFFAAGTTFGLITMVVRDLVREAQRGRRRQQMKLLCRIFDHDFVTCDWHSLAVVPHKTCKRCGVTQLVRP